MMAMTIMAGAQTQVVEVEYLNGDMDGDQQITVNDASGLIEAYVKNLDTRQTMTMEIDNSWVNDYIAPWAEQTTRNTNAIDSLGSIVSIQKHWIDNTLIVTADMAESIGMLEDSIAMLNAIIKDLQNKPSAQLPSEIVMPVEIPERYISMDTIIRVPIYINDMVEVLIPGQTVETRSKVINVGGEGVYIEGDEIQLPDQRIAVPLSIRTEASFNIFNRQIIPGETVISKATITPAPAPNGEVNFNIYLPEEGATTR